MRELRNRIFILVVLIQMQLCFAQENGMEQEEIADRIAMERNILYGPNSNFNLASLKRALSDTLGSSKARSKASRPTLDAAQFQDFQELGPDNIGGRIRSIAIHPVIANRIFAGSPGGGIWRTDDGGQHWSQILSTPNLQISHIAISSSNPSVIYAATGEFAGSAFPGGGIYKSTDGGGTWSVLSSTVPASYADHWTWIGRLWVHPSNPNIVIAGAYQGLYKSIDGGATWTQKQITNNSDIIYDIVSNPSNPQQLLIGGLFGTSNRSMDGGETWSAVSINAPLRAVFSWSSNPSIVYASAVSSESSTGALFKSTNGGQSFSIVSDNIGIFPYNQSQYDNCIWVDPTNPLRLVVGGVLIKRSLDGGVSFTAPSDFPHADFHAVVPALGYNGTTNNTVYVASDGGVASNTKFFASDFTASPSGWVDLRKGLRITQFYTVETNEVNIAGGTQDNGVVLRTPSPDNPMKWLMFFPGDGGHTPLSSTVEYSDHVIGESQRLGGPFLRDPASGFVGFINNGLTESGVGPQFIAPLLMDNNERLLAGARNLWVLDEPFGMSPGWRILAPTNEIGGDASVVAVAPTDSNVIWMANSQPLSVHLYRTLDGTSAHPTFVQSELPVSMTPSSINISKFNADVGFMTFWGVSPSGRVWKTMDGGSNWVDITGNLPTMPIYDAAQSPWDPETIYVATYYGIYATGDGGATWVPAGSGSFLSAVTDLKWDGNALLIATFGRGVFRASLPYTDLVESIIPEFYSATVRTQGYAGGSPTAIGARIRVEIVGTSGTYVSGEPPGCVAISRSGGGLDGQPVHNIYDCNLGNVASNVIVDRKWNFNVRALAGRIDITSVVSFANPDSNASSNTVTGVVNMGDHPM